MKKQLISLMLILALTVTAFVSCANPNEFIDPAKSAGYKELDENVSGTQSSTGDITTEGKTTDDNVDDIITKEQTTAGSGKSENFEDDIRFISQRPDLLEITEEFTWQTHCIGDDYMFRFRNKYGNENINSAASYAINTIKEKRENYEKVFPSIWYIYDFLELSKEEMETLNKESCDFFNMDEMKAKYDGSSMQKKLTLNYHFYTQDFIDALFSDDYDFMVSKLKNPFALYRDGVVYSYYTVVYGGGAEKLFSDGMTKEEMRDYLNSVKDFYEENIVKNEYPFDERMKDLDAQIAWLCDGTPLPDGVWCPPKP